MVKLYTKDEYIVGEYILYNDAWFDLHVTAKMIRKLHGEAYLKQIDGAEILDYETGTIKTPFGVCPLERLSTGTKTVMNILVLLESDKQVTVDVTECGSNALDAVFEVIDGKGDHVRILLSHLFVNRGSTRQFLVNDEFPAKDSGELGCVLMELGDERCV